MNYITNNDDSNKNINIVSCVAIIVAGVATDFLKLGVSSIYAILVTSLITIIGNYINNKIRNKGGSNSYENR